MKSLVIENIWMISDIHAGMRSNSIEWLNNQKDYFYNFFMPTIKKEKTDNDVLFILGDVFDNRQTLNILILNEFIKIFEDLSKILSIYILIGNHDIFKREENDVSSLEALKHIPNLHIYKDPALLNASGKKLLIIPWRKSKEQEIETLAKYPEADYVFSHSELSGVMLNKKSFQSNGNDINIFKNYKRVYSGHIHYSQKISNLTYLGNPYQMTRSDINNVKGIYKLNIIKNKEFFIENTYSPKFNRLYLSKFYNYTLLDFKNFIKNNYIDLYVESNIVAKFNITSLLTSIEKHCKKVELNIIEENNDLDLDENTDDYREFDVINITSTYLKKLNYDTAYKNKIIKEIKNLYNETINDYD